MIADFPRYTIKDKMWSVRWTPLPGWDSSSTGRYPENVLFGEYCEAYKFFESITKANKIESKNE